MGLFIPKRNTQNWYQYEFLFSFEIIESFVAGVERQAKESKAHYHAHKTEFPTDETHESGSSVTVYQGLDDHTWDLTGIFEKHFPSLQRRSALLTVVGQFEHEMDELCELYRIEKSLLISLSDLKDRGIDRSITYLEKAAGLTSLKQSGQWVEVKKIQLIRNICVHQDGKVGKENKPALQYLERMKELGLLENENEIFINEGYLHHVIETYKALAQLIDSAIRNSPPLAGFPPARE